MSSEPASSPEAASRDHAEEVDLERVHSVLLACLSSIDAVCERHAIEYWIDSGTLLGAVRHTGFIPWDDDIDLCMTRENLRRFLTVARSELAPRYSVQTADDDPAIGVDAKIFVQGSHTHSPEAARLGLSPTRNDGLYADIYIADPISPSRMVRKMERAVAWLAKTHAWSGDMARLDSLPLRKRLRWLLASRVPAPVVRYAARALERRMLKRRHSLLGVGPAGLFNGVAYAADTIYPLSTQLFAGTRFPAPKDPDTYLRGMYGANYMTLPPPEQRRCHADRVWFDD